MIPRKPVPSTNEIEYLQDFNNEHIHTTPGTRISLHEKTWSEADSPPLVRRKIHYLTPLLMTLTFIAGLGFFAAHHFYCSSKAGQPATSQEWVQRAGIALAFCYKTFMSASIVLCCYQCTWAQLRRSKAGFTIEELDALFGASSNLLSFTSGGFLLKASLIAVIAAVYWLMPLVAVLTPPALTVAPGNISRAYPMVVPALNFSGDTFAAYNSMLSTLSFPDLGSDDYGRFRPVLDPDAERLRNRVAFGGNIMDLPLPLIPRETESGKESIHALSSWWNLSGSNDYTTGYSRGPDTTYQVFYSGDSNFSALGNLTSEYVASYRTVLRGPLYQCSTSRKMPVPPVNTTQACLNDECYYQVVDDTYQEPALYVHPFYNCSYTSNNDKIEYGRMYVSYFSEEDLPPPGSNYFRHPRYSSPSGSEFGSMLIRKFSPYAFNESNVFMCRLRNASIPLEISFSPSQRISLYDDISYEGEPILFVGDSADDFSPPDVNVYNYSINSGPIGPEWMKEYIAYDTIMRDVLAGSIRGIYQNGPTTCIMNSTGILSTVLANSYNDTLVELQNTPFDGSSCGYFKAEALERGFEELSLNLTISLLSNQFVRGFSFQTQTVQDVTIEASVIVFLYNRPQLLIPYAVASFASLLILLAGFWALHVNGLTMNSGLFSTILATTRNPSLDAVVGRSAATSGQYPMPEPFMRSKLAYGVLGRPRTEEARQPEYATAIGFGLKDEITLLRKRQMTRNVNTGKS